MQKTVVAVYNDMETAWRVIESLRDAGFARDQMSLVAADPDQRYVTTLEGEHVTAGEGAGFGALAGAVVGLGAVLIPGVGPFIAGGPLVAALTGAGLGAVSGAATGGITGALIEAGIDEEDARFYESELHDAGVLVSVQTQSTEDTVTAERILSAYNPARMAEQ